jgi:hypothetical protein
MEYTGKFRFFDYGRIRTYPISERPNKVKLEDLIRPSQVLSEPLRFDTPAIRGVAQSVVACAAAKKPVIWMTGAHATKLGLSPLVIDLVQRGVISLVAMNGANAIHDFELALLTETSEDVRNALPLGKFGMAYETGAYMNDAINHGNALKLGQGESLARMILGEEFPYHVAFKRPDLSLLATCYRVGIPATVHVGIGTDIIDQHPSADGEGKGGTSARDFGIFAADVERMTEGGVFLNVGSAVTGPEVFLKAVSMAANVGHVPDRIVTADFDLRPANLDEARNDTKPTYYFRDIKSVVTRIPEAFNGKGYYINGLFQDTIPALYKLVVEDLNMRNTRSG